MPLYLQRREKSDRVLSYPSAKATPAARWPQSLLPAPPPFSHPSGRARYQRQHEQEREKWRGPGRDRRQLLMPPLRSDQIEGSHWPLKSPSEFYSALVVLIYVSLARQHGLFRLELAMNFDARPLPIWSAIWRASPQYH